MVKSTILIIAVAAVVVAAGACVYFVATNNNGDDKDKSEVEVYRDLIVGDKIVLGIGANIDTDGKTIESEISAILASLYPDITLTGEKGKVTINSKDYDCTICIFGEEEAKMAYYVLDSGFVAKTVVYSGDTVITDGEVKTTSLDPAKTADEQVLEKGSYVTMKMKIAFGPSDNNISLEGESRQEFVSVDTEAGTAEIKTSIKMSGSGKMTMEVESIKDGMVTMKDSEMSITMSKAMSVYSYKDFIKSLEEEGAEVAYGQKSSETMETEYGKRDITNQQVKSTVDETTHSADLKYGAKGVLYSASSKEKGNIGGLEVDVDVSYTLYSCTAVTTEEI